MKIIFRYLGMWLASVVLPAFLLFGIQVPITENTLLVSVAIAMLCSTGVFYSVRSLSRFPGNRTWGTLLPVVVSWYGISAMLVLLFRWPYSVVYLTVSFVFCFLFVHLDCWYNEGRKVLSLAYVPIGRAEDAHKIPYARWERLEQAILPPKAVDAVVADLHAPALSKEWQKFLAECTLKHIPVYNLRHVEESLTGAVRVGSSMANECITCGMWKSH